MNIQDVRQYGYVSYIGDKVKLPFNEEFSDLNLLANIQNIRKYRAAAGLRSDFEAVFGELGFPASLAFEA